MQIIRTAPIPAPAVSSVTTRRWSALAAALLGALILWGVGFAQPEIVHSAAHDARHAQGFPCH